MAMFATMNAGFVWMVIVNMTIIHCVQAKRYVILEIALHVRSLSALQGRNNVCRMENSKAAHNLMDAMFGENLKNVLTLSARTRAAVMETVI